MKKRTHRIQRVGVAFLVVQLAIVSGPAILDARLSRTTVPMVTPLLPDAEVGWDGPSMVRLNYSPTIEHATHRLAGSYSSELGMVEMHVAFFNEQSQDRELINDNNELFNDGKWRIAILPRADKIELEDGRKVRPGSIVLTDGIRDLLIWYWYDVGGRIAQRASEAKLMRVWNLTVGDDTGDAIVVFATPIIDNDIVSAAHNVKLFIRLHEDRLRACLRPIEFGKANCAKNSKD